MREPNWEQNGTFRKLAAMVSQFASNEVPGLPVTLELARRDGPPLLVTATSDAEGFVHFDVEAGPGPANAGNPAWERVRLHWTNRIGAQSVDAFVLAPGEDDKLAVISDIDDTIVETGAGDLWRNWRRVLAQMPGDREVVPGAASFYTRLHSGGGSAGAIGGPGAGKEIGNILPATRRPFFYVSSSPWNLFDYLIAFKKLHKLPQGPVFLRDWDANHATLASSAHKSHKSRSIDILLGFYPAMRFALIGDNTQADAIAYADIVAKHGARIAAVFIRQAPGADLNAEEHSALDIIRAAGVPLWLGTSYQIGADFLATVGFTAHGETTQIVNAIATGNPPGTQPTDEPVPAPYSGSAAAPVDLAQTPA